MKLLILLFLALSAWADIGTVMVVKGQAQLNRSQQMLDIKSGMKLLTADEILTKAKSRVQVMLVDNTVITIGANTSFKFNDIKFDGSPDSKADMKASRGFFRCVTGEIGKIAPERFKVKTASATIGIRGTDFSADIMPKREIIRCYSGIISVQYASYLKEIKAGKMIELRENKIEIRDMKAQREKNRDQEVYQAVEQELDTPDLPAKDLSDMTTQQEQSKPSGGNPAVGGPFAAP